MKTYKAKTISELTNTHVATINGVSKYAAKELKTPFGIKTVLDIAKNKYVKLSQGLTYFSSLFKNVLRRVLFEYILIKYEQIVFVEEKCHIPIKQKILVK